MKATIKLDRFKAGLEEKRAKFNAAARPAAQAGAQVIYDLARQYAPVSNDGHWFYGSSYKTTGKRYWFPAGSLRDSIYQVYSLDNSNDSRATYHISWNRTKAPYAWMVEFGTSKAAANPFMGPAILEGRADAIKAVRVKFIQEASS